MSVDSERQRLGRQLRNIRRLANKTQNQLAKDLGVRQATVSRWEAAISLPPLDVVAAYCRICECKPDEIFGEIEGQQLPLGIDPQGQRALDVLAGLLRRPKG